MLLRNIGISFLIFMIVVFGLLFFSHNPTKKNDKLFVVCTTSMITDAVKKIGGDLIEVHGLMGPGVDPHTYRATEGDVNRLASADIIFYNGLHLEGKMSGLFKKMASRTKTVAVTHAIPPETFLAPSGAYGLYDPHIWFDVELWQQVVATIRDTLVAADTDEIHQINYEQRAQSYLHELAMLHEYVQNKIEQIPESNRILITAHDAFGYFGRAYNVQVIGLQGISTDSDISTRDVKNLVEFIVTHKVPTLFVESSIPHRTLQAVQYAVQAQGCQVTIGGELFSDALGSPNTQAGTYIGMMRHNVDTIVEGLLTFECAV
jgi:manganese/zinc/iron transport system substrate-binding protein